jgi:two-component system sensor kinase FixL
MAAALAHELNQPLGAATNFLGAARLALQSARPGAPDRALARIEKAVEQTVRAGAILGRLRDFTTRGETDKRIVSAPQLLEDAVELALVGAKDPNLRIRFDFAPEQRPIVADRVQIQQVIFNLVRNALEATAGRTPREIIVATRPAADGDLEIAVADTGPGLGENPEAAFRPFATTKATGMGIGLSICRTIVEAHGGRLWAEPRPTGGAVFRFTLPLAPSEEAVDG